jgi:predicted adenine nucleotide alpha hydrolase (AANH) superfamily ATPase
METLIIQPKSKKELLTIKKVLEALEIKYNEPDTHYNQAFVEKIKQGKKDKEEGKGTKITLEDLDALWK